MDPVVVPRLGHGDGAVAANGALLMDTADWDAADTGAGDA